VGSGFGQEEFEVISVAIPRTLIEQLKALHVDIESEIIEFLLQRHRLDPSEEVEIRIKLARMYLEEGRSIVEKDPIQASEKLYKAAEECVKALAIYLKIEVLRNVEERGRWTVTDIIRAVNEIAKAIGSWILDAWDHAWVLHVWGFHEAKLRSIDVEARMPYIEKLVKFTEERISKQNI